MKIPYVLTNNSISLNFQGNPYSFVKGSPQYAVITKMIDAGQEDQIPSVLSTAGALAVATDQRYTVEDDKLFLNLESGQRWQVPENLAQRIIAHLGHNLPVNSWINFAKRLSNNPSKKSVDQLFGYLEKHHFAITEEGNFIAYKRVRSDYKDIYTGTMDNSPGTVVSMPRSEVNDDPEQTCSRGLHVAAYDYAANCYGNRTGILLAVEVSPEDVVSIPVDYSNMKMRTRSYFVIGPIDHEFKENAYSKERGFYDEEAEDDCEEYVTFM